MAGRPHPVRWRLEYGAVLAVGALARALPHAAAQAFVWPLARLAYALAGSRRREARRRLRLVLGPNVP
jgi:lauroyl/myristoyl acyltransferase